MESKLSSLDSLLEKLEQTGSTTSATTEAGGTIAPLATDNARAMVQAVRERFVAAHRELEGRMLGLEEAAATWEQLEEETGEVAEWMDAAKAATQSMTPDEGGLSTVEEKLVQQAVSLYQNFISFVK